MNMNVISYRMSAVRAALRYWSNFRTTEIVALQGSPLLGFAMAIHRPTTESVRPLMMLIAANICLVAHIFLTNDWADLHTDLSDPTKIDWFFKAGPLSRNDIAGPMIILLALSLFLFSQLGGTPTFLAIAIAAASAVYSLPQFHWKGRPILSSVLHLVGGALHFLLGYSVAGVINSRAVAAASFFALTFAAGHLTQELRDYQGDARSEIRTNAVIFGQHRAFVASLVFFTMAHVLLCYLALSGILPRPIAILVVLYPLHLYWSLTALADGLTYASICSLQARYRTIYAIIGLVTLLSLWSDSHVT
jgi:4-hydroxybenzoate polyprenyltransferase